MGVRSNATYHRAYWAVMPGITKIGRWLLRISASSGAALFLTALTIVISVSAAAAAIKLPCAWPLFDILKTPACGSTQIPILDDTSLTIFWLSVAVFVPMFLFRELSVAHEARKKSTELLYTIRTMPPLNIMEGFQVLYSGIIEFCENEVEKGATDTNTSVSDTNTSVSDQKAGTSDPDTDAVDSKTDAVDCGIRLCLSSLCALARNFERSYEKTRYAANIMTYIEVGHIPGDSRERLLNAMSSLQEVPSFEGLEGVLYLQNELSASTDSGSDSLNSDPLLTKELAIPIPQLRYNKATGRPRFLPGASEAMVKGNYIIDDTHKILSQYDEGGTDYRDLPLTIFENIDKYYRDDEMGKFVRSFLSIRITEAEGESERCLGVVNVHCHRADIFKDDWVYRSFLGLAAPIVTQLRYLLKKREVLGPFAA